MVWLELCLFLPCRLSLRSPFSVQNHVSTIGLVWLSLFGVLDVEWDSASLVDPIAFYTREMLKRDDATALLFSQGADLVNKSKVSA